VKCVCSSACGVMRPAGCKELATAVHKWSALSILAAPAKTAVLLSDDFRVPAAESGFTVDFTGWNVLTWLLTGLNCWPVSDGAGGAIFSVRRRTVFGLSGSCDKWLWPTDDADIWRNRGLSPALAPSLCRIWLRSISSNVEAFWWLEMSWIPVPAGLIQQQ